MDSTYFDDDVLFRTIDPVAAAALWRPLPRAALSSFLPSLTSPSLPSTAPSNSQCITRDPYFGLPSPAPPLRPPTSACIDAKTGDGPTSLRFPSPPTLSGPCFPLPGPGPSAHPPTPGGVDFQTSNINSCHSFGSVHLPISINGIPHAATLIYEPVRVIFPAAAAFQPAIGPRLLSGQPASWPQPERESAASAALSEPKAPLFAVTGPHTTHSPPTIGQARAQLDKAGFAPTFAAQGTAQPFSHSAIPLNPHAYATHNNAFLPAHNPPQPAPPFSPDTLISTPSSATRRDLRSLSDADSPDHHHPTLQLPENCFAQSASPRRSEDVASPSFTSSSSLHHTNVDRLNVFDSSVDDYKLPPEDAIATLDALFLRGNVPSTASPTTKNRGTILSSSHLHPNGAAATSALEDEAWLQLLCRTQVHPPAQMRPLQSGQQTASSESPPAPLGLDTNTGCSDAHSFPIVAELSRAAHPYCTTLAAPTDGTSPEASITYCRQPHAQLPAHGNHHPATASQRQVVYGEQDSIPQPFAYLPSSAPSALGVRGASTTSTALTTETTWYKSGVQTTGPAHQSDAEHAVQAHAGYSPFHQDDAQHTAITIPARIPIASPDRDHLLRCTVEDFTGPKGIHIHFVNMFRSRGNKALPASVICRRLMEMAKKDAALAILMEEYISDTAQTERTSYRILRDVTAWVHLTFEEDNPLASHKQQVAGSSTYRPKDLGPLLHLRCVKRPLFKEQQQVLLYIIQLNRFI